MGFVLSWFYAQTVSCFGLADRSRQCSAHLHSFGLDGIFSDCSLWCLGCALFGSTGYSSSEPFGDNNGSVINSASTGFSPTQPFGRYSPKVIRNASDGYSPTAPFRDNPSYIPPATQGYSSTTPFGGYNNGTVIEPASTGFSPTQPFGDNNGAYIEPATQARVRQSSPSNASQQSLTTYFARRRANPNSFQPYEHPINESGYPSMQSGSGFPTMNY